MSAGKIKRLNISEEVMNRLLERIQRGVVKSGERLPSVEALAQEFGVSRSAVREALSALRAMRLVEMRHGEGTFVTTFQKDEPSLALYTAALMKKEDIDHLLEVRLYLETGTSQAAATRRTDEDLRIMKEALQLMARSEGDVEAGEKGDFLFHEAIVSAAGNPILQQLWNQISEMLKRAMRETRLIAFYEDKDVMSVLSHEHARIYQAISQQDGEAASAAMRQHLQTVLDQWNRSQEKWAP
ncbi:FadR family transcriptional regulator [Bacillaceae bacterium SIJ1]|uniref:FadR/GntR family transcriptional regulator n=1 Tax=Litoribacterium kuwaitense TaxID=1398745 RepID=UPI0013EAC117|nr:FadR/GntR family transcriptional regulator [Litoribacterium kuwaitense]NGP46750.1 FadR family transcriptional regulator [Litoribacterium kuwaitense]